jgi:tetratricopeptide (TPR) repeat protein
MKKSIIFIPLWILLVLSLSSCGSSVERTLDSGNKAFGEQAYEQAIEIYTQAMEMAPTLAEPVYNLANTLYRMGAFEETGQLMGQALQLASDELAQHGFYNLGNSFFQQQQMDGAIESYKEALRLNPDDQDAKYNLELAMQQEQQQQEQEQQQEQQDQNQSGENQQEQDQSGEGQDDHNQEDQQAQNQEGEEQKDGQQQSGADQQDQDSSGQEEQDQQNQGQDGKQPSQQEQQNAQGQPQQLEGLTEEQARQILAAIGQSTQTLQEKLQEILGVPIAPFGKDW